MNKILSNAHNGYFYRKCNNTPHATISFVWFQQEHNNKLEFSVRHGKISYDVVIRQADLKWGTESTIILRNKIN